MTVVSHWKGATSVLDAEKSLLLSGTESETSSRSSVVQGTAQAYVLFFRICGAKSCHWSPGA